MVTNYTFCILPLGNMPLKIRLNRERQWKASVRFSGVVFALLELLQVVIESLNLGMVIIDVRNTIHL